jgi:hypothetical protein
MAAPKPPPDEKSGNSEELQRKSESLAREHSQKREVRLREERVRNLASDTPPQGTARDEGSASTSKSRGRVAATSNRANRIDDFPVEGEPRSSPSSSRPIEPLSRGPQGVAADDRPPGVVDDVAVELEELIRDARSGWRRLEGADRITFVAAVSTMIGVFLPWVSDPAHPFPQIGLFAGGVVHAALAVVAISLVVRRGRGKFDARGMRVGKREAHDAARRASLWHILLGAASTGLGVYFLVLLILGRSPDWGVKVHFGLYWTLLSGTGLSYGGFARFLRRDDG